MNVTLGTSFYVGIPNSTQRSAYDCVSMAADLGIQHFFTTVQMPEADIAGHLQEFRDIARLAERMELHIMADAHPIAFRRVGGSVADLGPFKEIGITDLRLDAGFGDNDTVLLQQSALEHDMNIVLNASALTEDSIQQLRRLGYPLEGMVACHNYYPRVESGMSMNFMEKQATLLHRYGIIVMGFVASGSCHRYITYEGLPTLEIHRNTEPDRAARELLVRQWADVVYIGDQTDDIDELRRFSEVAQNPHLVLRIQLNPDAHTPEREIALNRIHEHLPQEFEVTYRARGDRQRPSLALIIPQTHAIARYRGTVAVDNVFYPRYAGELHIAKVDLPADPRTNVVGHVIDEDLRLLDAIRPKTAFAFEAVVGEGQG